MSGHRPPGRRTVGLTLVEVLVALSLVALQAPAIAGTVAAAASLTRRADALVADLDGADLLARCHRP